MKLFTPDNAELIEITSVSPHEDGIQIEGTIMGAMPMKAVLRPAELRTGMRFLTPGIAWKLFNMLLRGR
jgi:hypothetical protein